MENICYGKNVDFKVFVTKWTYVSSTFGNFLCIFYFDLDNYIQIDFRTPRCMSLVKILSLWAQVLYHTRNICWTSCCHRLSSSCCQEAFHPNCFICSFGKNEQGLSAKARCHYYSREWFGGPQVSRHGLANRMVWIAARTCWSVVDGYTEWQC